VEPIQRDAFSLLRIFVVAACAALLGRALAHLIEGSSLFGRHGPAAVAVAPPRPTRAHPLPGDARTSRDGAAIIGRNVFCSGCVPPRGQELVGPRRTTLPLHLVATMVCPSDPRWSRGVIVDLSTRDLEPRMYPQGSALARGHATVVRVVNGRVYLLVDGRLEYLDLVGPATAIPVVSDGSRPTFRADQARCAAGSCRVDRALVERLLRERGELDGLARVVPVVRSGVPYGFRLYGVRPGSILAQLGLQNGDRLDSINGMKLRTVDDALTAYTKLRSASRLALGVERGGRDLLLDFVIE
jgi:type II secretory pathway component PulC